MPSATTREVFNARNHDLRNVIAGAQSNLLSAAIGDVTQRAIRDNELLGRVLPTTPALQSIFPGNSTGPRLAMVARLISVSQALGLKRQMFFVQLGGWDLHAGQTGARSIARGTERSHEVLLRCHRRTRRREPSHDLHGL